jgi:hypothetical protein
MNARVSPEIVAMVDAYAETALAYQFEMLFGPIELPLTTTEKQALKDAERAIQKAVWDIGVTLERLDSLPAWARGAVARAVIHETYMITVFRAGLPIVRRPGRESIREVVDRFCYRPRRAA